MDGTPEKAHRGVYGKTLKPPTKLIFVGKLQKGVAVIVILKIAKK